MNRARALRLAGRVAAIAGVLIAVVAVRAVTSSRAELTRGDEFRARADLDAAIVHYRRAARWYAPGSPYPREALDKLAAIGEAAARAGEVERALVAYRAVRAAVLGSRSFYTPHADALAAADAQIAELVSSMTPPPIDAGKSRAALRAEHLALLRDVKRPHVGWALVLLFGFALWVGSAFAFASRGVDDEDRFVPREARRWGALIVVGFGLFALGLTLA